MRLKIICAILLFVSFINPLSVNAFKEESNGWYLKRNGHSKPNAPMSSDELSEYSAFYIDEKICDTERSLKIYLTFDAGYENGNIEKIADILREKNVPSAFFILDRMILNHRDLVKRLRSDGHIICNHTKNHKDLTALSDEEAKKNILELENIYKDSCGLEISKYFRFPEGRYSKRTLSLVKDLGYKTVFWSLAYADWDNNNQPNPTYAIKLLTDNIHNGAVVLLHPTSKTNAEILPTLIDEWRRMGYSFGTLDELTA